MRGRAVTRHVYSSTTTDAYGEPTPSWVDVVVNRVLAYPVVGDTADNRVVETRRMNAILPSGTEHSATDEWTVGGTRYRQYAPPEEWTNDLLGSAARGVRVYLEVID